MPYGFAFIAIEFTDHWSYFLNPETIFFVIFKNNNNKAFY